MDLVFEALNFLAVNIFSETAIFYFILAGVKHAQDSSSSLLEFLQMPFKAY